MAFTLALESCTSSSLTAAASAGACTGEVIHHCSPRFSSVVVPPLAETASAWNSAAGSAPPSVASCPASRAANSFAPASFLRASASSAFCTPNHA